MRYFLIDALNVLYGCGEFQKLLPQNLPAAAAQLERLLSALGPDRQALLVYDGGAAGAVPESTAVHSGLTVLRTPTGIGADGLLVELVRRIRRGDPGAAVTVVSDDGGLQAATAALGGEPLHCDALLKQLQQRELELQRRLKRRSEDLGRWWPGRLGERLGPSTGGRPLREDLGR
ncbi:MAG: NYN domain-containing protein [Puniceicoccales bacterium]|nr:NYN domain-containing protein [Puniceicoccales bacterium]